jgi:hypothetical protein
MIVPTASTATSGYAPLQELLRQSGTVFLSHFNDRPSKLFEELEHLRLSIVLVHKTADARRIFSTALNKWSAPERPHLFGRLSFVETTNLNQDNGFLRIGSRLEASLLEKLAAEGVTLGQRCRAADVFPIWYTRKLSHFVQVLDFVPRIIDEQGLERRPSELKAVWLADCHERDCFLALLNSSLFFWTLAVFSDGRNLNRREIHAACFAYDRAAASVKARLGRLCRELMSDLRRNSRLRAMRYRDRGTLRIQCIYPRRSKGIIDEIDRVLAEHYGFSAEELDFLLNFDIKYRLGLPSATP